MKHQIITTPDSIRISPKIDGVEIFADYDGEQWIVNTNDGTEKYNTFPQAIKAVESMLLFFADGIDTDASYEAGSLSKWVHDGNKAEDWQKIEIPKRTFAHSADNGEQLNGIITETPADTPDPRGESRLY